MYNNWEELETSIVGCKKCKLCENRNKIVFGCGNQNANIMFIGECPELEDDEQGLPFMGKAGKMVYRALEGLGINKDNIYFTNIVKCKAINDFPRENECNACLDYLRNQVILVKPKIIVLFGNMVLKNILGKDNEIVKVRGKWIEKKGIKYITTWNPAFLLKDESKKIEFWNDLKMIVEE